VLAGVQEVNCFTSVRTRIRVGKSSAT
jgi:hypothetical protein